MRHQKLFTSDEFGMTELCASSGARRPQAEGLCRANIVLTHRPSRGLGSRRRFKGVIPILDATEACELTKAGYSYRQIKQRFDVQRAALAGLSPAAAVVTRYRFYIATIVQLADLFGRGDGYDEWLATQQAQLRRMERALARDDGVVNDDRLLNLFASPVSDDDDAPAALAG